MSIDPTARIAPGARIGSDVEIGPYCVIGGDVTIGDRCRLMAHVHVTGHTTIGAETRIAPFASLGTAPQSVHYLGEPTRLVIGTRCDIREHVTMNIGTARDRGVTVVGSRCFFMVGAHVAHDCVVGDDVTFANNATLGGHVTIGNNVFIGGLSAVHQHGRVGEGAMLGGLSAIREDVIPFGLTKGTMGVLIGMNLVGLRRRKVDRAEIGALRRLYRILFLGEGLFADRLDAVQRELGASAYATKSWNSFVSAANGR